MIALIFALALSGTNPLLPEVNDKPQASQNIWKLSGPRWSNEAFYINAVNYYENVPSGEYVGRYTGQPYMNIQAQLDNYGTYIEYILVKRMKTNVIILFISMFAEFENKFSMDIANANIA